MYDNKAFIKKLKDNTDRKVPVIGSGVGCGLTASACEEGGSDFVALYHTAMYRVAGLSTILSFLPYDNCNKMVLEALPSVRCNVKNIPLFVGLGAHDPRQPAESLVEQAIAGKADGIVNEPFCGSYGPMIHRALNACGLGFQAEFLMIKYALSRGLLALGWSFSVEEALQFAQIGTPFIGVIVDENSIPQAADITQEIIREYVDELCEKVKRENPDAFVLLHGKAVDTFDSIKTALKNTAADGFFTGSSGERIPAGKGVAEAIRDFHSLSL